MHLYVQHATASGGSTILEAGRTRDWDAARHGHALRIAPWGAVRRGVQGAGWGAHPRRRNARTGGDKRERGRLLAENLGYL